MEATKCTDQKRCELAGHLNGKNQRGRMRVMFCEGGTMSETKKGPCFPRGENDVGNKEGPLSKMSNPGLAPSQVELS